MENLAEKYPAAAKAIRDAFAERFGEFDTLGIFEPDRAVREVHSQAYDGFIPFTNGGATVSVLRLLGSAEYGDASGKELEIIQPYAERARADAAKDFIRQRPELSEAWEAYDGPEDVETWLFARWGAAEDLHASQTALGKVPFYETPAGKERESFYEFQDEYMNEGGDYYLKGRAHFYAADNYRNSQNKFDGSGSPADEVYFYSAVNTDFTYGRDKYNEICFERTYKLARLTPRRVRVIVEAMAKALT